MGEIIPIWFMVIHQIMC